MSATEDTFRAMFGQPTSTDEPSPAPALPRVPLGVRGSVKVAEDPAVEFARFVNFQLYYHH
jgi:hypothetical protein